MTAQLSREIVENLLQHNDESDSPANAEAWEVNALCRLALAGMDSKPVGVRSRWKDEGNGAGSWLYFTLNRYDALASDPTRDCELLYAAPPSPVAVPDERKAFEEFMEKRFKDSIDRRQVKNGDGEYMAWDMIVAWIVWQGRAAMLKAGPVTATTVPDGWKLVPLIAFPSQWAAGQKAFNSAGINKVDAVYKAMVEAAPTAPEQEV